MTGPSPHHHLSHHPHHSHPAIVTPGVRQDLHTDSNHRYFQNFMLINLSLVLQMKIKRNLLLNCLREGVLAG